MNVSHFAYPSSIDEHVGCFHPVPVVINALTNIVYKYLLETLLSVLLGKYPQVELLDHMLVLCLIFEEPPNCFPRWLYHFTLPPAMHKGSNLSTISDLKTIFVVILARITKAQ